MLIIIASNNAVERRRREKKTCYYTESKTSIQTIKISANLFGK